MRWLAGCEGVGLGFEDLLFGFVIGKRPSTPLNTFAQGLPFRLDKWIVHWMPRV
ncbi:hypothetical protein RISK_002201 [Rhodopirellula islandica]|uniref:Uncharacterized protein n=1 Tax=Rhodopirellula islandica TaxID=595434 RepID=A0A0J1EJ56_RHOIS|nr:hypothetical protein RISK_002201 [Rhodopirellula islandica]